MRAMVLDRPAPIEAHPLTAREVPRPEPGPDQVLLRVSVCGVCRTDLHTVEADFPLPRTPIIPGHQDLARRLGAAWVGAAPDAPPEPLDASVIFAPAGDLVPHALEGLDKGGTLALAGIHLTDIPSLTYEEHVFYEKTLTSVTAATRVDGRELLQLADQVPIRTEVQTFDLADANRVLERVKASQISGAAVLRIG